MHNIIFVQEPCFNVHYIEFFTDNLYQSTLLSKVSYKQPMDFVLFNDCMLNTGAFNWNSRCHFVYFRTNSISHSCRS